MVFVIALLVAAWTLLIWTLLVAQGNNRVYSWSKTVLALTGLAAQSDIAEGRYDNWEWRYDEYRKASDKVAGRFALLFIRAFGDLDRYVRDWFH